ncbi:MAG: PqqD family protein [Deltaproteobacteria bacterium]|nr:PqqD family protein [Deltaproteobacteria bacterium]
MLSPDQTLCLADRMIHRVIGDEVFVLMFDSRIHWLKNTTARALWDALVAAGPAGLTPRQAAGLLVADFEVDEGEALADATVFLANLLEKGLVDSNSPPA